MWKILIELGIRCFFPAVEWVALCLGVKFATPTTSRLVTPFSPVPPEVVHPNRTILPVGATTQPTTAAPQTKGKSCSKQEI